ncbi:MAG: response regulator [Planctomycetota bacterium]
MHTNRKKLLIVEDDDELRLAMSVRLGHAFQTTCAQDGLGAVGRARAERPDAILLDLGLPCGDGFRVLESLRTNPELADIPVVVLTGRDAEAARDRALDAGASAFLTKPAEPDAIVDAVRAAVAARRERTCVLLVEDDDDQREGLAMRLRARDLVVVLAQDGASALMKARKYAPDVVVLDLGLPGGDGMDVMRRMKQIEELANIPIIVLTGRDDAEAQARAAGADAFLQKPADHEMLLEAIGGAR